MGIDIEEDLKRRMVELNLFAARSYQSPHTKYVHLNYESEGARDTIPLFENFCFALALFRSRISENVLEGKTLLENLLFFEVDGNFPIYLHEYPQCKDRDFSLKLLPVFHWLLIDFRSALGDSFCVRLKMLIGRILSHGYKMHAQRPLSKSSEFRLKSYFQKEALFSWVPSSPEEWAEALITWQMAASLNVKLDRFLEEALERWHPLLCTYIGPQHQDRSEPKTTLLDLFMGQYYGHYSNRALQAHKVHLLASLIQPFNEMGTKGVVPTHLSSSLHAGSVEPYTLYWGSLEKLNSLFLDSKMGSCSMQQKEGDIAFTLTLPPHTISDSQDVSELSLFMNLSPSQEIYVQGLKATTFQIGDSIDLVSEGLQLRLRILIEKGEGRFFGHILRGNRPNQKGNNLKFETYDWQIALRTIRRSEECILRVEVTIL